MPIAYDNQGGDYAAAAASHTLAFTITGSNTHLWVAVMFRSATPSNVAVTANGAGMTSLADVGTGTGRIVVFGLAGATTGDVVASWDGGNFISILFAMSHTGVHQTTPRGTTVTAASGSVTATTASDEVVVDACVVPADTLMVAGADQLDHDFQVYNGAFGVGGISDQAGSAGGLMSWTDTETPPVAIAAVSLKPAAATTVTPSRLSSMHVG